MTTAIKRRRGTTTQHATFTGLEGEITVDTTKDTLVVHDGATAGGFPLAKENNPTFTGSATFSSGTANGVAYLNGSKVLTTGNALTFDGTNFSTTGRVTSGSYLTVQKSGTSIAYIGSGADIITGGSTGDFALTTPTALGNMVFGIANNEGMRLTSTGLGIGTTSPSYKLDVVGSNQSIRILDSGGTYFIRLTANGTYNFSDFQYKNILTFTDDSTERMRIDSSGNLLVGTPGVSTAPSTGFVFNPQSVGSYAAIGHTTAAGSGAYYISFGYNGSIIGTITQNGTTAVAYNTSSDYRLKENIQPMQNALGVVAQLNPVTYTWKVDGSDGQGFIAHELQAVVPDCVTGEKDAVDADGNPVYQGIDTSFLVATLTKAIQELKAEVDSLKAQLENK